MTTVKAFIAGYPVMAYIALTFAISWGGVLLVIGPRGIPATPEQFETLLPFAVLAMLAGPSVAGVLLTGIVHGRSGFHELLCRLLRWRVDARWYAVVLLTAPLAMTAIPLALSLLVPEVLPRIFASDDKAALLLFGVAAGLGAGIFEELGWTGFAIPRLRLRYGALTIGLMVGVLWGTWHLLVNVWSSGSPSGALSMPHLLHSILFSVGVLPAYRALMVWVYDRTRSLLAAMLMHASLTTSNVIFVPLAAGASLVTWPLVVAAVLWLVLAAVAVADGPGAFQNA